MRFSRYVQLLEDEGRYYVFSTLTCSLLKLNEELYEWIWGHKDRQGLLVEEMPKPLDSLLMDCGFLVPDGLNEVSLVKREYSTINEIANAPGYIISPTLRCNFDCYYCFEHRSNASMDRNMEQKVVSFIATNLPDNPHLRVCWFGGEPLLMKRAILRMSRNLMDVAEERGGSFGASMTTNGYLLDEESALTLEEHALDSVMITLDGPAPVHDSRRTLKGGGGTFNRILENVESACDIINNVVIRVNIDSSNISEINELIDLLFQRGLDGKIGLALAPVSKNFRANPDSPEIGNCLTPWGYSHRIVSLWGQAMERGFNVNSPLVPRKGGCGAVRADSFVIDPQGDLYPCVELMNLPGESFGNVEDGVDPELRRRWLEFDPFEERCTECNMLPICMGGCPLRRMSGEPLENRCCLQKNPEHLKQRILLYDKYCRLKNNNK